jgi:7,8-dihydropterin-6-yl-methyl-4-(beta-D-ribofuranosyl)aminobenzene 5'-phosphate synthase
MHRSLALRSLVASSGFLCCLALPAARAGQAPAPAPGPSLTVLFDNAVSTASGSGCTAGWGFSALIEGLGRTVLFDAGAQEAVFATNLAALKVDVRMVDLVFVSHDHTDHTGGLALVLGKKPGVPVYVPASANAEFQADVRAKGGRIMAVRDRQEIVAGAWSTGDLGQAIHEQALVIDTPRGLVVVTGCAHPGVVSMLEAVKAAGKKDIWMVLGGFHLNQTPTVAVEAIIERFKALGVQRVGATHCTGDPAIAMFRKAFGPGFVELGVGRKIQL